jgi:hypothetical protein
LLPRGLWQQMQGPRASQTGSWGLASSQCGKKPPKHRDGTAGRCSFMIDPVFVAFASGTRLRYACRRTSRRNESGLLSGAAVVWGQNQEAQRYTMPACQQRCLVSECWLW